jgi:hypothetical protein
MTRFLLLLLAAAALAGCGTNGGQLFNSPLSADPQERAGTRDGTMAGAGGTFKSN